MSVIQQPTISGFNEYITSLKGQIRMTLTKFSSGKFEIVYNAKHISEVPKLSTENYKPNGGTPLYDAIGKTIAALESEAEGRNVIMTIMTDGEENESREFTKATINKLIRDKQEAGWVFTFLGANQDAWQVGMGMGISQAMSINFAGTAASTRSAFMAASNTTNNYVAQGTAASAMFNSKTVEDYELQANQIQKQEADKVVKPKGTTA